jgi:hypothetical protein
MFIASQFLAIFFYATVEAFRFFLRLGGPNTPPTAIFSKSCRKVQIKYPTGFVGK